MSLNFWSFFLILTEFSEASAIYGTLISSRATEEEADDGSAFFRTLDSETVFAPDKRTVEIELR